MIEQRALIKESLTNEKHDMQIRNALPEDIPNIFALTKALATIENKLDNLTMTESTLKEFLFSSSSKFNCIVLLNNNKFVGHALYYFKPSSFSNQLTLYLEDFIIEEKYRSHGFGKHIMVELRAKAKQANCKAMEWSVMKFNTRAQKFYRNIGAQSDENNIYFSLKVI